MFGIRQRILLYSEAIGTDGNRFRVFVGAAPKYSPSRIMQIIKSITCERIV
jgi:putative transposase